MSKFHPSISKLEAIRLVLVNAGVAFKNIKCEDEYYCRYSVEIDTCGCQLRLSQCIAALETLVSLKSMGYTGYYIPMVDSINSMRKITEKPSNWYKVELSVR